MNTIQKLLSLQNSYTMNDNTFKTEGKRLLILGGSSAKDIVVQAKRMGVYTIVADWDETNKSKEIADESVIVSTTDIDALVALIREKSIDGVFTGPSEFNLQQVMRVCDYPSMPHRSNGIFAKTKLRSRNYVGDLMSLLYLSMRCHQR